MKATRTIATGVLLGLACQTVLAVAPNGVQRPTPPPCAADGQCLASPTTFGYYDTRWRRWPQEAMAPKSKAGAAAAAAPPQEDVVPFVTPPMEQEDRKAPPPSVPTGEAPMQPGSSGAQSYPSGPGAPSGQQGGQQGGQQPGGRGFQLGPQTTPLTPPQGPPGQPAQPNTAPTYRSVPSTSPLNRSGTSPMGEADPPPSLPFGPTLVSPGQLPREVSQQQPRVVPAANSTMSPATSPSHDPPPSLPITLASYEQG